MPIECNAYDPTVQMMFGGDSGKVSSVVLNAKHRQSHGLGEQSGTVIWVKIADDEFR